MTSPILVSQRVRSRILADHALLRGLLGALTAAVRASLGDEKQRFYVRQLLAQFGSEVERHLAYEETELMPLLRSARAESLAKEHAAQRAVLLALAEDAEDGVREIGELAEEIFWFGAHFEADMAMEEGRLLVADARSMTDSVQSMQ